MQKPAAYSPLAPDLAERLDAFGAILLEAASRMNLTGAASMDELRTRHFADALAGLDVLDGLLPASPEPRLIDVGSGAGLPGMVLALARPAWRLTLLDATRRKCEFLETAASKLGLANVEVCNARAEETARSEALREAFDAAVARAVAPLGPLLEIALPFVRPGGAAVCWKGSGVDDEMAEGREAAEALGASPPRPHPYELSGADGQAPLRFHLVVAHKRSTTPRRYPRSAARLKRRPYRP